jgi:hypothetical protein
MNLSQNFWNVVFQRTKCITKRLAVKDRRANWHTLKKGPESAARRLFSSANH